MKLENFIPQPFRDMYTGDREVKAAKASGGRDIFEGTRKSVSAKGHLALAALFTAASFVAGRYLKHGSAAVRIAGTVISLPATLIGEGARAIVHGLKTLPGAVTAKSLLGIGKSAAYIGGGTLALEASSSIFIRDLGLFEEYVLRAAVEQRQQEVLNA